MSAVNLTVPCPKEINDALVALDGLVQKIVAKETVTQILIDELAVALKLASEASAIPGDLQGAPDQAIDAGSLYGRRIVYRLLGKDVIPVVVS